MNFSNFLDQEMKRRGWSQSDLSRKSGLSRQAISFLLLGRTQKPDAETASKLAEAFDIPPEIFFRKAGLLPQEENDNDDWALVVAARISKLPAQSRNFLEAMIDYFYEQERSGGKGKK